MNEDQLRALVREAVARHLEGAPGRFQPMVSAEQPLTFSSHASHFRYSLPDSGSEYRKWLTCEETVSG